MNAPAVTLNMVPEHTDAGPVRGWVWVLSQGPITVPDGRVFDLDADATDYERRDVTWADAKASLAEWFSHPSRAPQIQRVHRDEGHSYGFAVPGEYRFLTGAEAVERGVPAEAVPASAMDRESLFALVEFTDPDTARQYERGQIRTTSPSLHLGFVGDSHEEDGKRWPVAVLELSITSNPVQKTNQIPADSLRGVTLASPEAAPKEATVENGADNPAVGEMPDRIAKLEEGFAQFADQLNALAAEIADMRSADAADPDKGEEMAEHDEEKAEMARKLSEVEAEAAELRVKVQRSAAELALADYTHLDDEKRAALLSLGEKSADAFALALDVIGKPERTTEPVPTSANAAPDEADAEPSDLALTNLALAAKRGGDSRSVLAIVHDFKANGIPAASTH